MSDHFCRLENRFVYGQGKRWRVVCKPCRWTSQWHRTAWAANDDYETHAAPAQVWSAPPTLLDGATS